MKLSALGASIVKPYAIAIAPDNSSAEIDMYGEVVKERPKDDEGNSVEGNYIVETEFLESLRAVAASGAKYIFLRLNSVGGSCFSAIVIYNKLMEMKADITARVDGVSMSAAFFIMQAANTIEVFSSSLLMLHTASMCVMGYYNAMDLNKQIGLLDGCDGAMINAIVQKTGKSKREVTEALQVETYMTGAEAVERGYADKLVEDEEEMMPIVASADRHTVYAAGREINLPFGYALPDGLDVKTIEALDLDIPKQTNTAKADLDTNKKPAAPGKNEGGSLTMAKSLEELKTENPDLAEQLMAEARATATDSAPAVKAAADAERDRIKKIDEIAPSIADKDLILEAKYGDAKGENTCTAEELAFRAMKKQAALGGQFMTNLKQDTQDSNAQDVPAGSGQEPDDGKELTPEQRMAAGRADAKKLTKKED